MGEKEQEEKEQEEEATVVVWRAVLQVCVCGVGWGEGVRTAGAPGGPDFRGYCQSSSLLSRRIVPKLGSTLESLWEL